MSKLHRIAEAANQIPPAPVRHARAPVHTPVRASAPVREDYGPEEDYEGEMATSQLKSIEEKAAKIASMLKPESKLEAWVQSKITMADDYITTVHDYLKNTPGAIGESEQSTDEGQTKSKE